jgi:hypothetical protein
MMPTPVRYLLFSLVPFALATTITIFCGLNFYDVFGVFVLSATFAYGGYEIGHETKYRNFGKYLTIFSIVFGLSLWPALYLAYRLLGAKLF